MANHKVRHKNIKLLPTEYTVDVFVCKNKDKIIKQLNEKVDKNDWGKYFEDSSVGMCLYHTTDNNVRYLIMILSDFNPIIISHECIHISWRLADYCGFNFREDEEIQAYFVDYMVGEILKMNK